MSKFELCGLVFSPEYPFYISLFSAQYLYKMSCRALQTTYPAQRPLALFTLCWVDVGCFAVRHTIK